MVFKNIFNYNNRKAINLLKSRILSKPYRKRLISKLLKNIYSESYPKKWVFVVGCYNSGTSLLKKILSTHSQISTFGGEGAFFTDELITPEELGWPRMWCQVIEKVRLTGNDNYINAEEVKKDWSLLFNKEKKVFLEKSIVNSARMLWLQKNFNNSYFIFIIRNGYAVSEGIRRRTKIGKWKIKYLPYENGYPINLCAKQWVINNKIVEEDSKFIRRFKRVFYENLCERPDEIISSICKFLGLNNELLLNSETRWKIQDNNIRITNLNERSINNLTLSDILKIEEVASPMLNYYNYKILSK